MKILIKKTPVIIALIQALAVSIYCLFAAYIMNTLTTSMHNLSMTVSSMLVLIFFIFSALISGSLVFAYPIKLFFIDGKEKKEAMQIVIFTTLWLIFIFIILTLGGIIIWQAFYE